MKKTINAGVIILSTLIFLVTIFVVIVHNNSATSVTAQDFIFDEEDATVRAIKKVIPTVVTIIIDEKIENIWLNKETGQYESSSKVIQRGSGTGFLISSDGYILTNKHVIEASQLEEPEFRIILNSGKEYYAQLIDKDPAKDLGVLKIFDKDLPYVELADSDELELGISVIAIGNSLGRYQNSVTKGIVSGLGRYLQASSESGSQEVLDNVIQTDAEINTGNSGGPLINLYGKVVGVNTAVDRGGTAIGFAIPVNDARPAITSVIESGRIIRPFLGVRYLTLTLKIAYEKDLPRSEGAWIIDDESSEIVVIPDSPASEAGLLKGDIIYEINAIPIDGKNTLYEVIQRYKPGEKIGLKIQRGENVIIKEVLLSEFKNF